MIKQDFVKESTKWGNWESRTTDIEGKPWLREIAIAHVHDGNEYPVATIDCAGEDFGPELADWIVALNNDAPKVIEAQAKQIEMLTEALEKLARLGNGDFYGNSDGNIIAQRALGVLP